MTSKRSLLIYLSGTMGQIFITCMVVFLLRHIGMKMDYTTGIGIFAIGVGGISSAVWGTIVAIKHKNVTLKEIMIDFINVKQPFSSYLFAIAFLLLDFCYVLFGGKFQAAAWYIPIVIFFKSILFGGIEEIGWRYTFQSILEEKLNYICSTLITFVSWGTWHLLYFYIEGSLYQVQIIHFLIGLLVNCFILSTLYNKTRSLWICVMTHALINTFAQISSGGNSWVSYFCSAVIIFAAIRYSAYKRYF